MIEKGQFSLRAHDWDLGKSAPGEKGGSGTKRCYYSIIVRSESHIRRLILCFRKNNWMCVCADVVDEIGARTHMAAFHAR